MNSYTGGKMVDGNNQVHQRRSRVEFVLMEVGRMLLGVLFIWASLPKIRQPYDFLSEVYGYEILGPAGGVFIAMLLPWLEMVVGICLLGGIVVSGALCLASIMSFIFVFAISSALHQGLNIACGCFGTSSSDTIDYWVLGRAFSVFAVSAYLAFKEIKKELRLADSQLKVGGHPQLNAGLV